MDIAKELKAEIAKVTGQISSERKIIKHATKKGLNMDDALAFLKQLETHKEVLEQRLADCTVEPEPAIPSPRLDIL